MSAGAAASGVDARCACGHAAYQHDPDGDPFVCNLCGSNTWCDYADAEAIAADRWDEGWHAAVISLCPPSLSEGARLLWALDHMPQGNPYRNEGSEDAS